MLEGRSLVARAGQLVAARLHARAEAGDADAMYELGKWYQYAPNEADWRSAHHYRWYKRAMNQGLTCAALAVEEVLTASPPEAGLDLAWLALRLGAPGWPISRVRRGLRQVGLAACGPAWAPLALLQDRDRSRAPRPRMLDWHRLGLPSHVGWSPRYLEARLDLLEPRPRPYLRRSGFPTKYPG